LLAHGRWFSTGTPASATTKTGRHDLAESQTPKINQSINVSSNPIKEIMIETLEYRIS
jgi:hypothetical protein